MSKGMILVAGLRFEITSIRLRNARFEVTAERPGPVPVLKGEPAIIFGEDGTGVMMGGTLITERATQAGEVTRVMVTFQVRTAEEIFLT